VKEEVTRIMRLVKEGKLSPEDAAELVEAFVDSPEGPGEPSAATDAKPSDPFAKLIEGIEKVSKDVVGGVNWQDVAGQVRQGVNKGVESFKQAVEEAKKSGSFGFVFGQSATRRIEMPLDLSEGQSVRIEGGSGDVRVFGGASSPKVVLDASFRAFDEAEAKKQSEAFAPVLDSSESHVVLRRPDGPNVRVEVELHVPAGTPVELSLAGGDVDVKATRASCRVQSRSGDVRLASVAGSVDVSTSSGDIAVMHSDVALLTLDSRSGDISLEEVSGTANIKASSGDITLARSRFQTLAVELASGDVTADLCAPVTGTVSIRTVNGNITLGVADGSDCRVSLSSLSGSVATQVELANRVEEGLLLTGRLGEGNGSIDLSAVRGDVRLELRDCAPD
jgi:DUF4097 and DUF4098 domain-containing protein YvlB